MIWFLKNLVSAFLLPPLSLIVLGVAGVLFLKNHPVLGKFLIISTFILFYILSIPIFAERALQTLEVPTRSNSEINKAQAIVILGSGTYFEAPEYGGHTVDQYGLERVLENEFHVPVEWSENNSRDTRENADNSFSVLRKNKITHIALVTHAWHMLRATREFERAGFKVTPASTAYVTQRNKNLFSFIPSADAFSKSRLFIHEAIGILWYRLTPAPDKL